MFNVVKLIKIYKIQLRENNNINYEIEIVNLINIFNGFIKKLYFYSKINKNNYNICENTYSRFLNYKMCFFLFILFFIFLLFY